MNLLPIPPLDSNHLVFNRDRGHSWQTVVGKDATHHRDGGSGLDYPAGRRRFAV